MGTSTARFSFEMAKLAFEGQYTELHEEEYAQPIRERIFRLPVTGRGDYQAINYVFNLPPLPQHGRSSFMVKNGCSAGRIAQCMA